MKQTGHVCLQLSGFRKVRFKVSSSDAQRRVRRIGFSRVLPSQVVSQTRNVGTAILHSFGNLPPQPEHLRVRRAGCFRVFSGWQTPLCPNHYPESRQNL